MATTVKHWADATSTAGPCSKRLVSRPIPGGETSRPVTERAPSISRAFAWTFSGRMLYGLCQWGILSVLAKLGDTVVLGRFALALAITAPLSVFANLQLRSVYATDVHEEFSWSTYWRLRIRLSMACFVLLLVVVLCSATLREEAWAIGIMAAAKAVEMTEDLLHGVFQRNRAMHYYGRSLAIRGVLSLVAITVPLAAGLPLEASLGAMLIAWIAVVVMYDWPRARRLRTPSRTAAPAPNEARRLLWLALPMGSVMLLDSLNQNVPRYFAEWLYGSAQLGMYVAMAYLLQLGGNVIFSLGAPLANVMARDYAERRVASFIRQAIGLAVVTLAVGIGGVLFASLAGRPFLRLMYSEPFAAHADAFVWVMIGAAFHYVILMCNTVLTVARRLRVQPVIWCAALASTTAAAATLVPPHGILGAAQAFAFGVAIGAAVAVAAVAMVIHDVRREGRAG
jgi:O-antigen/teichoic acid export membrane protein